MSWEVARRIDNIKASIAEVIIFVREGSYRGREFGREETRASEWNSAFKDFGCRVRGITVQEETLRVCTQNEGRIGE